MTPEQEWTVLFAMLLGASLALGFTAPGSPAHLLVLLAALVALLTHTIIRRRRRR